MKTNIINYDPGSKGDFIINFLNNKISFQSLGQSNSSAGLDTRVIAQGLPNERLYQYADLLLERDYKELFISSHDITNLRENDLSRLLKKYDLYHIIVEDEWRRQVSIDFSFKVLIKNVHFSIIEKQKASNIVTTEQLLYNVDIFLLRNNKPFNDKNRVEMIYTVVENHKFKSNISSLINPISYNSLFAEPFEGVRLLSNMIEKNLNEKFYKELLKKSFLPKQVKAFGYTFDVEKLGYRYYI